MSDPGFANPLHQFINRQALCGLLEAAKREDLGSEGLDLTSRCLIPADRDASAQFRARQSGRLAGAALLPALIEVFDDTLELQPRMRDGGTLQPQAVIARISGRLTSILALERVALNFLIHLSGIATLTGQYVDRVAGTGAVICDTRKTLPGLRALEKYAVVCGGGTNHRMGLHDAVLIKDNHLAHVSDEQLPAMLKQAVTRAAGGSPRPAFIEVEVDRLEQLPAALGCGADIILLDNMDPAMIAVAVTRRNQVNPAVLLEASGGIGLDNVRSVAETGVDRIAVGALTHSAPALDIGLDIT